MTKPPLLTDAEIKAEAARHVAEYRTMPMIERVARAICQRRFGSSGRLMWQLWTPEAEAAIAAMREPTEAMCEAVVPFPEHLRAEHPDPADPWHRGMTAATLAEQATAGNRYSRMIDAALAEEP